MPRNERSRRLAVRLGLSVLVLPCCGLLPRLAQAGSSAPAEAASEPSADSAPQVRIVAVRGVAWHGSEAQVDLLLQVSNPRGWSVVLNDIRMNCSFNGVATATGRATEALDLPAHGRADVPVSVTIDGQALLTVLASLPPDGSVRYTLEGDAEIGDTLLRVPFQKQGSVILR